VVLATRLVPAVAGRTTRLVPAVTDRFRLARVDLHDESLAAILPKARAPGGRGFDRRKLRLERRW
jgi:hypothetical protein